MATINGTEDNETIIGTAADETINGAGGDDFIAGDDGNDLLHGDAGNDTLDGGNGNDTLHGDDGNDVLAGGADDDIVYGGAGGDVLDGNSGNDVLDGGADEDRLNGGTGNDVYTGGTENDEFVFGSDHGEDTITDFDPDNEDILFSGNTYADKQDVLDHTTYANGNAYIDDGNGNIVVVENVAPNSLNTSNVHVGTIEEPSTPTVPGGTEEPEPNTPSEPKPEPEPERETGNWYDDIGMEVGLGAAAAGIASMFIGGYKSRAAKKEMRNNVNSIIAEERIQMGSLDTPLTQEQKEQLSQKLLENDPDNRLLNERARYAKRSGRAIGIGSGILGFGAIALIGGLTIATGGIALAIGLGVAAVGGLIIGKFASSRAKHSAEKSALKTISNALADPDATTEKALAREAKKQKSTDKVVEASQAHSSEKSLKSKPVLGKHTAQATGSETSPRKAHGAHSSTLIKSSGQNNGHER